MTGALIVLGIIALAQLAIIYGLTNRLLRQSGQSGLSAAAVLKQAEKMILESHDDTEKKPFTPSRMGRKIGTTGPIEQMPSYMQVEGTKK